MTWIYLFYVTLIFIWQTWAVVMGNNSRKKAIALYVFFTASPIVLCGVLFMGLLGYEMYTGTVAMSEEFAKSLIFITAIGAVTVFLTTPGFVIALMVGKPAKSHIT